MKTRLLDLFQNPRENPKAYLTNKIEVFLAPKGSRSYLLEQKTASLPSNRVVGRGGFERGLTLLSGRVLLLALFFVTLLAAPAVAAPAVENPQSGSVGLEGTLPAPPPEQGATIVVPTTGQVFSELPIRVGGLCPDGLLVRVFANEIFVGSTMCEGGSYELQAGIFGGQNELVARVYDTLDQAGPDSNLVQVTFNDAQFGNLSGTPLSLTSDFARRGADPKKPLAWPFILSGGSGPYAVSIDYGDGSSQQLISLNLSGVFEAQHTYDAAGVYKITVRATDADGQLAFLQVVGVANGQPAQTDQVQSTTSRVDVIWWPAALTIFAIFIAFWLGRRYQIQVLRSELGRHRES